LCTCHLVYASYKFYFLFLWIHLNNDWFNNADTCFNNCNEFMRFILNLKWISGTSKINVVAYNENVPLKETDLRECCVTPHINDLTIVCVLFNKQMETKYCIKALSKAWKKHLRASSRVVLKYTVQIVLPPHILTE
jgi:hypothetical protein